MPLAKEMTTIWISKDVKKAIDKQKGNMTYNTFLTRLILHREIEIYFELLSVDGEPPEGHDILFKLGNVYYRCKDGVTTQTGIMVIPIEPGKKAEGS